MAGLSLFLFGMLAGLFNYFLPSRQVVRWGLWAALWATLLFAGFWFWSLRTYRIDLSYYGPKKPSRWKLLLTPLVFFLFFWMDFVYGLPWMAHRCCHPARAQVDVTLQEKSHSRLGCQLKFQEYDYLWFKQLAGIRSDAWEALRTGDRLTLHGTRSKFGFIVEGFSKRGGRKVTPAFFWGRVIVPLLLFVLVLAIFDFICKILDRRHR